MFGVGFLQFFTSAYFELLTREIYSEYWHRKASCTQNLRVKCDFLSLCDAYNQDESTNDLSVFAPCLDQSPTLGRM